MELKIEDVNAAQKRVVATLVPDDIEPKMKKVVRTVSRNVRIPGFRPGKAPMSLVLHRYRDMVEEEILHDHLKTILKKLNDDYTFDLLKDPEVESHEIHEDWSGEIVLSLHLYPALEMPDVSGLDIQEKEIEVSEDDINGVIEEICRSHAKMIPVEGSAEQDSYCLVDLTRIDEEGKEEALGKQFLRPTGEDPVPELEGVNVDATISFTKDYPADTDSPLAGKRITYRAKVLEIKRMEIPAVEDILEEIVEKGESLDDLKGHIREELMDHRRDEAAKEKRKAVWDQLLARVSVEVPPEILEQTLSVIMNDAAMNYIRQGGDPKELSVETFRKNLEPVALRRAQIDLLVRRMSREWEINVEDDEVVEEIRRQTTPEKFSEVLSNLRKNGRFEDLRWELIHQKVYERILKENEEA